MVTGIARGGLPGPVVGHRSSTANIPRPWSATMRKNGVGVGSFRHRAWGNLDRFVRVIEDIIIYRSLVPVDGTACDM